MRVQEMTNILEMTRVQVMFNNWPPSPGTSAIPIDRFCEIPLPSKRLTLSLLGVNSCHWPAKES